MRTNGQCAFPPDYYYDRATHVWARYGGATVTIGLDALGLESLGDLAYLALQPVGASARRGEAIGSLEAAKMVGELLAPVSGTIAARNEAMLRDPGLVNRDPYGAGWIVQITPSDWERESAELIHGPELQMWIETEVERYRSQGWIE